MTEDDNASEPKHTVLGRRFGHPGPFRISARWAKDHEPIARRPVGYGWSMGELGIEVLGRSLTATRVGDRAQSFVGWYLAPFLDWLATNWAVLFHEERAPWAGRISAPAAMACRQSIGRWIADGDAAGQRRFAEVRRWYQTHGLRSAAAGGLFPDLFIRRVADDVELSWLPNPPPFAPPGLTFEAATGHVRLAVDDVATPLWQLLNWATASPPELATSRDRENHAALCAKVQQLQSRDLDSLISSHLPNAFYESIRQSFQTAGYSDLVNPLPHAEQAPYISTLPPAVAMFGGASPDLTTADVATLRNTLIASVGGQDCDELAELVHDEPLGIPYRDGEDFAIELLLSLAGPHTNPLTDIQAICKRLHIAIIDTALETDTIRGAAIAGEGFSPRILVNRKHPFNSNEAGRRFTIAHELCHILFDRTRAKTIAHTSGRWANPGIEQRANAFAAYLLMPHHTLSAKIDAGAALEFADVQRLAGELQVNVSALIEHLYNVDMIDDAARVRLNNALQGTKP